MRRIRDLAVAFSVMALVVGCREGGRGVYGSNGIKVESSDGGDGSGDVSFRDSLIYGERMLW